MIELRPVAVEQASGEVRAIFDELRGALALPWVPSLYQAFAMYPRFLAAAWQAAAPRVRTARFDEVVGDLVADARRLAGFYRPSLVGGADGAATIKQWDEWLRAEVETAILAAAHLRSLDGKLPPVAVTLVEEGSARPAVAPPLARVVSRAAAATNPTLRHLDDEIASALGLPLVPMVYQALGVWPRALARAFADVRDAMALAEYRAAEEQLDAAIDAGAARVSLARTLDRVAIRLLGLGAAELANLSALIHMFQRVTPGLCLQVVMLQSSM